MSTSARGRNGVLPVPAVITKKNAPPHAPSRGPPKASAPRLRLIIRRLPPGLLESEFWAAVGDEWKYGAGKVDWVAYKDGKISKDPSKPSRPARAYLKVKEPLLLDELSLKVKQTQFQDVANSTKDPCLLGPPSLEFAPYTRVPGNRVRHDGRQGTIDQDQEFIDFLQSLTEPVTRPTNTETSDAKQAKPTTTPLVQYLKEKKASKAKEAAAAKSSKAKQDAKDSKAEKSGQKMTIVVKSSTSNLEKARLAKATQDTVKAINKSVASMQGKGSLQKSDTKPASGKDAQQSQAKPPRERGSAVVANRILQRDLGLAPKEQKVKNILKSPGPSMDAECPPKVKLPATTAADPKTTNSATVAANTAINPSAGIRGGNGGPAKSSNTPVAKPPKPLSQPSAGAKSAFLKHANASQGVTEDLLRTAFEAFGELTKCEIDKKKGFGYIDFAETDGLRKAMQAGPVKVGNGQVVVLENKTRRPVGNLPMQNTQATAPPNVAKPPNAPPDSSSTSEGKTTSPTDVASVPNTSSVPSAQTQNGPPRGPRVLARGGPSVMRGGRGFAPGRGGFQPPRGAPRGNFRGGRGGGRGGTAPSASATTATLASGSDNQPAVTSTSGAQDTK